MLLAWTRRGVQLPDPTPMSSLADFYMLEGPDPDDVSWMWLTFSAHMDSLVPGPRAKSTNSGELTVAQSLVIAGKPSWTEPTPFRVLRGRRRPDVFGTSSLTRVVDARLAGALHAAGCTGIVSHPAVIYDRSDRRIIDTQVVWVSVLPGAGAPDRARGMSLLIRRSLATDPYLRDAVGLFFDVSTWTGADVFSLGAGGYTILSRRAAMVVQQTGLTALELVPVLEAGRQIRDRVVADRIRRGVIPPM